MPARKGAPFGLLMRILAVAQRLVGHLYCLKGRDPACMPLEIRSGAADRLHRLRDQRVELRRVRERFSHQAELEFQRRPARARQLLEHLRVVGRIDDDQDVAEVLARRAEQRRTADVDLLDQLVERRVRVHRRVHERVEVHDDEIDQLDAVGRGRLEVVGTMAPGENPAVDLGVQRLDAAVHHLGKAGHVGDVADRQTRRRQGPGGAPGGHQFHPQTGQAASQLGQAGFIRNTQNRTHYLSILDTAESGPLL